MSSYGSLGNQGFYGSQSQSSIGSSMTYNPSMGSLGSLNQSATRINNRGRQQAVGRVLTNSMLQSNHSMMSNEGNASINIPIPPIPADLIGIMNEQCNEMVRQAYIRGFQDAQMQHGLGKKRRSTKKKTTRRKRSTSRK